ncbi:MAG: tetratricopeptide repeat protein [Cyanobacteria bacterium P01_H01_bin.150]
MSKELKIFNHFYLVQSKNPKNKTIEQYLIVALYCLLTTSLVAVPFFTNNQPVHAQKSSLSLVKQGNRLLKKGWVDNAIKVFRRAVKRNPQSITANLGLAIAYKRAGNIDAAWDSYQRVLSIDPNNQLALKTVGLLGTYRPEWQVGGIKALSNLLNFSPNDFQARSLRALLYYYQGRINDSVADYQILLANNPTPEIILGAAETYTYAQNYTQALELFNRYLYNGKSITSNAAIAYGRTLQKTGNPTQAIEVLETQLRGDISDSLMLTARAELSQAYLANNQQAQALDVLQPLRGRQDAVLLLAGALNEIRKRTNDSAIATEVANLYQQVLADNPNPSASLLLQVADVFSGLPQGEEIALQLYEQAAAKLPNDKSLVLRQLALKSKLGLISQNTLQRGLTQALQTPPQDTVELQKFASALVQINTRNPEFIPAYQNILQTGVDAPFLNFRIAQMYLQQKKTISARQALAAYTATSEGTNNLAAQLLAAEIELQEGNIEASARRYQAVLKVKPDNDEIINGALRALAGLRSQQKRFDEALSYYNQLLARQPQNPTYQLGQISVGYQAKKINQQQATTVLNNWLATQKATSTPPELYSLVGQLPASVQWEPLYKYLLQLQPDNLQIQERWLQVVAQRNPGLARALVKQFAAANPNNSTEVEGQLSKAIGELNLAGIAYEKVLTNQPDNMDALAALGGIRFEQSRYEAAEKIYSQILTQKPQNQEARMAIADLNIILDKPLAALVEMEKLHIQQMSEGVTDPKLEDKMQKLQEDFLLRRGFQPFWEDPNRRIRN